MRYLRCPKCAKKGVIREKAAHHKGYRWNGTPYEHCKYCGYYKPAAGHYVKARK